MDIRDVLYGIFVFLICGVLGFVALLGNNSPYSKEARDVKCRSNLHSLVLGVDMFSLDNKERLPGVGVNFPLEHSWKSDWYGGYEKPDSVKYLPKEGSLYSYVGQSEVYKCSYANTDNYVLWAGLTGSVRNAVPSYIAVKNRRFVIQKTPMIIEKIETPGFKQFSYKDSFSDFHRSNCNLGFFDGSVGKNDLKFQSISGGQIADDLNTGQNLNEDSGCWGWWSESEKSE